MGDREFCPLSTGPSGKCTDMAGEQEATPIRDTASTWWNDWQTAVGLGYLTNIFLEMTDIALSL